MTKRGAPRHRRGAGDQSVKTGLGGDSAVRVWFRRIGFAVFLEDGFYGLSEECASLNPRHPRDSV